MKVEIIVEVGTRIQTDDVTDLYEEFLETAVNPSKEKFQEVFKDELLERAIDIAEFSWGIK